MLMLASTVKVYLGIDAVDMRKSYNGLYAVVANHLQANPLDGALYVFTNRHRNRLKILYCDGSGLWVFSKRLEKGTFSWPAGLDSKKKLKLSGDALALLLSGIDLKEGCRRPWYQS